VVSACILLALSGCGRKARVSVPSPSAGGTAAISSQELEGLASYYAEPYHGRRTANGEVFDTYRALTAAHRTLPFDTLVRVTNKTNGQAVDVRINDRGPFIEGRVIDLSLAAARRIDMERAGIVPVKLTILKDATEVRRSANGPYYAVQVGAFESAEAAETLRRQLANRYPDVSVQTVAGEKTVYRVRLGLEADVFAAEKLVEQLRRDRLDSFVVRVN
jgi:rare lipoprotein A